MEKKVNNITSEIVYEQTIHIRFYALLSFHQNSELFPILLFYRHALNLFFFYCFFFEHVPSTERM